MIEIDGLPGFYYKNIVLLLDAKETLTVALDPYRRDNYNRMSLKLLGGRVYFMIFKIKPEDPPYVLRRKIVGVSLRVVSRFPEDYRHISSSRRGNG